MHEFLANFESAFASRLSASRLIDDALRAAAPILFKQSFIGRTSISIDNTTIQFKFHVILSLYERDLTSFNIYIIVLLYIIVC